MVWDVSTPSDAKYVTYLAPTSDDYGPEVITFVSAEDSPTGRAFVMTANEVSGSVTVYDLEDPAVTKISAIQGEGASSAMVGQTVTVEAIVVGHFQNGDADSSRNLNGFYLQEEAFDADGNPLTSEGIFIYGGSVDVAIGDRVRVTGTVSEYYGLTEISASSITVLEANAVADINTMATEIDLPAADSSVSQDGDYQADLEAYEGMLVTIPETLTVTEQYNLDRFNEIKLVAGERPEQFTQDNAPDAEAYQAYLEDLGARTITYDDGLNVQNTAIANLDGFGPVYNTDTAPRMGDTVTGLTGVLDYQWAGASASGATWRVRSVENGTNTFEDGANVRTDTPADVGGDITVACFNVLNYFVTLDNGASTAIGAEPRGADTAEEFARQTDKLVDALIAIDADVLALIELENDFLEGSSGNAIAYLVDELNAVLGAGTYDWVRPGERFVGTDAIAVGFIYKPSAVEVSIDTTIETLDDSDLAAIGMGDLLGQSTVGGVFDGENTSRNALAVTFTELATGEEFTAIANHLKSKSGTGTGVDADQLDGQGAWQNQRELAATALTAWAASDPTGSGDTDILLLGDFNAYSQEDAIGIIEDAGYEDLQAREGNAYSYVFDGQTGTLDYVFANTSLASQVTGVTTWHINADEADALDYNTDYGRDTAIFDADTSVRVSDHDPLIIGLDLTETPQVTYTLQILHASDFEAGLKAVDRAGNFAAIVDYLEETYANSITLSSGDNFIPSPFFSAGGDPSLKEVYETALETYYGLAAGTLSISPGFGTADMAMLDIIGVQASAVGNHEFDAGTKALGDIIKQTAGYPGAQFPYLSANLDFSGDSNLASVYTSTIQDASNYSGFPSTAGNSKKIAPATIIEENGEMIGVVGATTQIVESISSTGGVDVIGDDVNDMAALAAILQPTIDALLAQGINKIILVSHLQQLSLEQELAPLLHGVDVIVAGGSHTLLADDQDTLRAGDTAAGTYPIVTTNADGKTTLIVNTDGEYSYVGRLVVSFDENGDVIADSVDANVSGAYATTDEVVEDLYADVIDVDADGDIDADDADPFAEGSRGDLVDDIAQAVGAVIDAQDGNVFGSTDVYLEGRRAEARTEETNLGDLSADANLWYAQKADATVMVSIKNGGGIRDSIGTVYAVGDDAVESPPVANEEVGKEEGEVSQLDIANSLRFNNSLSLVTVTAAQLLLVLEHAVAATTATATPGQFAQIGGIAYSFDKDLPAGSRVLSAALLNEDGVPTVALVQNGELVVDPAMAIRVVTLSFLLTGGDSYPFASFIAADPAFANVVNLTADLVPDDGQVATFAAEGTEQDAFAEYMAANYSDTPYDVADTDKANDTRIQNLDDRADTVLQAAAETVKGDAGNNTLTGALGNDILWDGTGNDTLVGNDGNDYLVGGAGADTLIGGAGIDTAVFSTAGSGVIVNLATGQGSGGDAAGDTYDSIEQVIGSAFGDTLIGDDGDNVFQAGAGDDTVNGGGGNDIIYAGAGADAQNGGAGTDRVIYSASAAGVTVNLATGQGSGGDAEGDTFSGIEQVIGSEHADTLIGDGVDNALKGGSGDDRLNGGAGNDILIGDAGADTFVFNAGFGIDQVKDFAVGTDTIEFSTDVFADFAEVQAAMVDTGSGYLAIWADTGTNGVGLWGVTAAQLTADDFRFV
ncbi:ExeM/NucH family extracellular endonuclease [Blastochloris sulfoviridis]|uniref:ExeM/NucH family extracellular endonuclease n=2 Tax=Blastochloris sulfoviridis TaxID=50712 RepID=A0A5M6HVH5_9HYPH|nr:ExeM/NucH family extracellular endonuclease [Blastochloris sulfoviridis]